MFEVIFPIKKDQRYYDIHYAYVLEIFKYLKCRIIFSEGLDVDKTTFKCFINKKEFLFDFADSSVVRNDWSQYRTFKFHTHERDLDKVIPFPSVSFYNWNIYFELEKKIKHSPNSSVISNRQRAYGNATERRTKVQNSLKALLHPAFIKTEMIDQLDFWHEVNDIALYVGVPGYCTSMTDRGVSQMFAFGCPVITPGLPELLPFNANWDGCYINCSSDYTDLCSLVLNQIYRTDEYHAIGIKAKETFQKYCTPQAIGEWIGLHVKN